MLRPGDVMFVMHHNSLISRGFAWFMASRWSHVAMVAERGHFDTYLHETSDTQTKVGLLSLYEMEPQDEIEVWRMPLGGDLAEAAAQRAASQYHNRLYGYLRLVGAGMRRLFMKLGWQRCPMPWPWGGPLCMMMPHSGLASTFKNMPAVGSIDTQELYMWCRQHGTLVSTKRRGVVGLEEVEQ